MSEKPGQPLKLKLSREKYDELHENVKRTLWHYLKEIEREAADLIDEIHIEEITIWVEASFNIPIKVENREALEDLLK